ncbi:hypothetical protein GCM10028819_32220 [Spirosoma humi]
MLPTSSAYAATANIERVRRDSSKIGFLFVLPDGSPVTAVSAQTFELSFADESGLVVITLPMVSTLDNQLEVTLTDTVRGKLYKSKYSYSLYNVSLARTEVVGSFIWIQGRNQAAGVFTAPDFRVVYNPIGNDIVINGLVVTDNTAPVVVAARAAVFATKLLVDAVHDDVTTMAAQVVTIGTNAANSANTASTKAGEALSLANAAANSATAASTKAGEALTSANAANTKAGEALASANAAAGSAGTANTKAGEALTSAGTASTKAGEALTSANAAAGYANSASTKAGEALASANAASGSATTASTKAGDALTSANAAAGSASSASTKAGEALTSAGTASTKASEALASASAAAGSASTANTKAGEALSSANAAANSATAAGIARDAAIAAVPNRVVTASAATTYSIDLAPADNTFLILTLTANTTLTIQNAAPGKCLYIDCIQGGAGSFVLTFPSAVAFPGGASVDWNTAAGKCNTFSLMARSNSVINATYAKM